MKRLIRELGHYKSLRDERYASAFGIIIQNLSDFVDRLSFLETTLRENLISTPFLRSPRN